MNPLLALINEVMTKQPIITENADGEVIRVRNQIPGVVGNYSLSEVISPNRSGPRATGYGNIIERSIVARFGAHIVTIPGLNNPNYPDPGPQLAALLKRKERFLTIEAAPFVAVPDDDELELSAKPYLIADYNEQTAPLYGVGFTLSRSDIRDLADNAAIDSVVNSIEMGLANIVDHVLLAHLDTAAPLLAQSSSASLLKAAAARGLRFTELSAIAGGELKGAEVAQDGTLRAYGIRAELTPYTENTIVGAFNRAAVGIEDDFRITAYRKTNGSIEIVCWVMAQAQVPDSSAFWRI